MSDAHDEMVDRLLDVVEQDIVPLTREGVAAGNKIFGAAILSKRDLSLVVAGTNGEVSNPLFHGEIDCINRYWALPADARPAPRECLFFSTHEPCSLCLSAITWSGFDAFHYLFSYESSRDDFGIPHDLRILEEVFGVRDGAYRETNAYWRAESLEAMVACGEPARRAGREARMHAIAGTYAALSDTYQSTKAAQPIPLA